MHVYYDKELYEIKLDITEITPEKLDVFHAHTKKDNVNIYGIIEGNRAKIEQIKETLIHTFRGESNDLIGQFNVYIR